MKDMRVEAVFRVLIAVLRVLLLFDGGCGFLEEIAVSLGHCIRFYMGVVAIVRVLLLF